VLCCVVLCCVVLCCARCVVVDIECDDTQHDRDYCSVHAHELGNDHVRVSLFTDVCMLLCFIVYLCLLTCACVVFD
jgi:hypothetical protein